MTDYISRDEIFSVWRSMPKPASIESLTDAINRTPAADVEPVRHGKNLDAEWPSLFTCSACGWSDGDTTTGDTMSYNYCPNCGAKMDLEEENNDD